MASMRQHASQPHPLQPMQTWEIHVGKTACGACNHYFTWGDELFGCRSCGFFLHSSCLHRPAVGCNVSGAGQVQGGYYSPLGGGYNNQQGSIRQLMGGYSNNRQASIQQPVGRGADNQQGRSGTSLIGSAVYGVRVGVRHGVHEGVEDSIKNHGHDDDKDRDGGDIDLCNFL